MHTFSLSLVAILVCLTIGGAGAASAPQASAAALTDAIEPPPLPELIYRWSAPDQRSVRIWRNGLFRVENGQTTRGSMTAARAEFILKRAAEQSPPDDYGTIRRIDDPDGAVLIQELLDLAKANAQQAMPPILLPAPDTTAQPATSPTSK